MLRLSKLTDYATVILSFMARDKTQMHAAMEIASTTGIALPTVSKILKLLVNANVLISTRGAKGGYVLARMPEEISVATVISALEGPIALTECSISQQNCGQASGCNIGGNWSLINRTIHIALDSVTLADLIRPVAVPEEVMIPVASLYR
jgi:FeS assembly SUF system regulator